MIQKICNDRCDNILFVDVDSLQDTTFAKRVKAAFDSQVQPKLCINCNVDKDLRSLLLLIKDFNPLSRITVVTKERTSTQFQTLQLFKHFDMKFSWNDLHEETKAFLMEKEINFQGSIMKLSDLDSSKSLCKYLPLNDIVTGTDLSVDSQPRRKNLLITTPRFKRTFSIKKTVESFGEFDDFDDSLKRKQSGKPFQVFLNVFGVIKEAEKKKIVIISGVAGAGKTDFLTLIPRLHKRNFPTSWVSFIDLKQHAKSFDNVSLHSSNFREILCNNILKLKKAFDRELFLQLYQKGKVVILMDGFDEISPRYSELVLSFLKSFDVSSENQLWITTRSHCKQELEIAFGQEAIGILPLSEIDQTELLVNYWGRSRNFQGNVKRMAEDLVFLVKSKLDENCLGTTLILRMMTEVFDERSTNFDSLTFTSVFKSFIENQLLRRNSRFMEKSQREFQLTPLLFFHQEIALKYFFDFERQKAVEWPIDEILRIGIVNSADSENFFFVHETFAEYFVADFVLSGLRDNQNLEETAEVLLEVLTSKRFQMVRVFLDDGLKVFKENKTNLCKEIAGFIENKPETEKHQKLLHCSLEEGHEKLVEFVFVVIKSFTDAELVKNCLRSKTEQNETILSLACSIKCLSIFKQIWDCLSDNLGDLHFIEMCLSKNNANKNLLHSLVEHNKSGEMLEFSIQKLMYCVGSQEVRNLFTARANFYGMNVLMFAASCVKELTNVKILLEFAKKVFVEDFISFLNETDETGGTFFFTSMRFLKGECVRDLWANIKEIHSQDQLKTILTKSNKNNENVFHAVSKNLKNTGIFMELWSILKEVLSREEILQLIEQKDNHSVNILNQILFKNDDKAFEDFVWVLQQCYDQNQIKAILLQRENDNQRSALNVIARSNTNTKVLSSFWEFSESVLSSEELQELLRLSDNKKRNIFHLSCQHNCREVVEMLFGFVYVDETMKVEDKKAKVQELNANGETILHCAAWNFINYNMFFNISKILGRFLNEQEIFELLEVQDKRQFNVFQTVFDKGDFKIIKSFLEFLSKFCENDQKKILLAKEGRFEQNVLGILAQTEWNKVAFELLWNYATIKLSPEDLKDFLCCVDNSGKNALSLAKQSNNNQFVKALYDKAKAFLTGEEQEAFLTD